MSRLTTRPRKNVNANFELLEKRQMMSATGAGLPVEQAMHASVAALVAHKHTVKAVNNGTGLTAEYFDDAAMTAGRLVRTDPSINMAGKSAIGTALKSVSAAKWTGSISPNTTDTYYFSIASNGPVTLTVNGVTLINTTTAPRGSVRATKGLMLTAGTKYSIVMTYIKKSGANASVKLLWAGKKVKNSVVPQSSLYPSGNISLPAATGALIGQYFIGNNFQTPVLTRVDPSINFSFGTSSPNSVIPGHTAFSIRWTGQIIPTTTETYTFNAKADDGIRVFVGGSLIVDDWTQHATQSVSGSIALTAGQAYDFKVEYFQNGKGVGDVNLQWSTPTISARTITPRAFISTPAATAGVLTGIPSSSSEIDLNWTGSSTATGYYIQQSTDGGVDYTTLTSVPAGATTYAVTGLTPATNYLFRVVPFGSSDTSMASNIINVMTLTDTPGALVASTISSSEVDLAWADVAGENGFNILATPVGGLVTASVNRGPVFTLIGTAPAGATSYAVTGLLSGTQYLFEIQGINTAGIASIPTDAVSATTTPSAVGNLTDVILSSTSLQLTWLPVHGATGYLIQSSPDGNSPWSTYQQVTSDINTLTISPVGSGSTGFYRVISMNAGGQSDPSSDVAATVLTEPPGTVTATPFSSSQITLNWTDVPNESGFVVLLKAAGVAPVEIDRVGAGVLSDTITGLVPGLQYSFEVESLNTGNMASAPSGDATTTTPTIAPDSLIALGLSTTSASLVWSAVPGATGYRIESSTTGTGSWSTLNSVSATTLTYTDTTLTAGSTRYYRIRGIDAGGLSDPSPSAMALTLPAAPVAALTGLSTAVSQVSWNAVNGASSYLVQRSTNQNGPFTNVTTVAGTSTSTQVANLATSTVYYYKVVAGNGTGQSAPSSVVGQMSAPAVQYQRFDQTFGLSASAGIFNVNMTAGTSTLIGQALPGAFGFRRNPNTGDLFYYVTLNGTTSTFQWDPTTGNNTAFAGAVTNPWGGAFRADGMAFVATKTGVLSSVTANPHVATTIGTIKTSLGTAVTMGTGNMAFDATGTLYLFDDGTIYTINTSTAVASPVITFGFGSVVGSFGDNNQPYFTTPTGAIYALNLTGLVSTLLGTAAQAFTGLAGNPEFDNLSATVTGAGTLTHGTTATYGITLSNSGPVAEPGPTTVTTTLPAGFTFTSVAGTGWTASVTGQVVTLTYTGTILVGGTTPPATLSVALGTSAVGIKTTMFTVSGQLFDTAAALENASVTNIVV